MGIVQGSGPGPINFLVMASDLHTISSANAFCKYADDMNLLNPEHSDVGIEAEFLNVMEWADRNKMIINVDKTKEIVFRRPCPRQSILPPA